MSIADLMQAMSEAGAPMEAILIAVRAIEAKDAEIARRESDASQRRAKDAARKRAVRAVSTDIPQTIHGQSVDMAGTFQPDPALSLPPNENNSNPPTHTHPDMVIPREQGPWDAHVLAWQAWRKANPFPKPHWADAGIWRDLRANRKRKRLADTATAHRKFLTDLFELVDDEWPPGRLLEAIVARGWGAAYDPRETRNDRSSANQRLPASRGASWDRRTGFERAADEHGGLRGN